MKYIDPFDKLERDFNDRLNSFSFVKTISYNLQDGSDEDAMIRLAINCLFPHHGDYEWHGFKVQRVHVDQIRNVWVWRG